MSSKKPRNRLSNKVIEEASFSIDNKILEKEDFLDIKIKLKVLNEKKEKDLQAILVKKGKLNAYYETQNQEFMKVEGRFQTKFHIIFITNGYRCLS